MPSINPRRSSKSASPPPRRNRQAEDGIRDDLVTGVQTCALPIRSEEHTSELQSPDHLVCRLLLDLGFRVQGKVIARLVDTGQVVKVGQKLMQIDPTDYTHAITVRAGDVAVARARWIQAAADEKRDRGLVESGAISQLTYDQAKAAADSATALLSAAEAQEKVAQNQSNYSVLRADADATVVETLAEPGQVVTAGQIVIRLAHAGPREASVDLPETARPALGSEAQATLYGGNLTLISHMRQPSPDAH